MAVAEPKIIANKTGDKKNPSIVSTQHKTVSPIYVPFLFLNEKTVQKIVQINAIGIKINPKNKIPNIAKTIVSIGSTKLGLFVDVELPVACCTGVDC